jgi:hypothetical protein
VSQGVELRAVLARHAETISEEDLDAVNRAYELITQAGLSIGEEGEDWIYDGTDERAVDSFDKFDLERLIIRVFFPPLAVMVSEAYGVSSTSKLGYPRAFDEHNRMLELVREWANSSMRDRR